MTMADGRSRYVMVGGFLGAGKTTSILRLAWD
jgi:G3E family GTPase